MYIETQHQIFGSLSKRFQNLYQFEILTQEFSQFMVMGPGSGPDFRGDMDISGSIG